MTQTSPLVPVILAGGSGTRLWPLSRAAFPKHLVELLGERSLLQTTAVRLLRTAPAGRLVTVAAAGQAVLVRRQLGALDPELLGHVLLEPSARNTAAAVAFAAVHAIRAFGPESVLWVCPSDHLVLDEAALLAAVRAGLPAASAGRLVTFGIAPDRPETGFGWIETGEPLGTGGALAVRRFIEKPPLPEARRMLEAGGHSWNSGMFLMRADVIMAELDRFEPALAEGVREATADGARTEPEPAIWAALPSLPIDKAVMERSGKVACVPVDPRWSDVGSWRALHELMPKDEAGNALVGDALVERASGNLVRSEHRLVALAGVKDLAVIETADAVLVADLADAEAVKTVASRLAAVGRAQAAVHAREHRPWGFFTNLAQGTGYRVRELLVEPGGQLVLQRHDGRDEHWLVVGGRALVTLGRSVREVPAGNTVFVPQGTPHRLANPGPEPLRLIEVQMGEVLDESRTVHLDEP